MTCCGAVCSPSNSIPMKWLFRIPLCFVISRGVVACARAGRIVRRIWRGHRPVKLGQVATTGATIVRTPWHSRCSSPCEAVQRQRRRRDGLRREKAKLNSSRDSGWRCLPDDCRRVFALRSVVRGGTAKLLRGHIADSQRPMCELSPARRRGLRKNAGSTSRPMRG